MDGSIPMYVNQCQTVDIIIRVFKKGIRLRGVLKSDENRHFCAKSAPKNIKRSYLS